MIRRLVLLGVALVIAGGVRFTTHRTDTLTLSVIDVGQGDAVLIRTPHGVDVLVDAGPNRRTADALGRLLPNGDTALELVVLTHPHADHIAGFANVLDHYRIDQVWESGVRYDAPEARAVARRIVDARIPVRAVGAGDAIALEPEVRLEVLSPPQPLEGVVVTHDDASHGGGLNDSSVVLRLTYRTFCALLMGDASESVERALVAQGSVASCAVLKVGHHGSRFASSTTFLDSVQPRLALISVGANRYGHPTPAALRRLNQSGATVLRTDTYGTITLRFDEALTIRTTKHPALDKPPKSYLDKPPKS